MGKIDTETTHQGHGREEIRRCWTIDDEVQLRLLRQPANSLDLQTIVMIESERPVLGKPPICERRYFIIPLVCDARKILAAKRAHWQEGNKLHWCLDVGFLEEQQRSVGNGAANPAVVRHIGPQFTQARPFQGSLKRKRKRAGWNNTFLEQLLKPS